MLKKQCFFKWLYISDVTCDYSYDTRVKLHFYEERLLDVLGKIFRWKNLLKEYCENFNLYHKSNSLMKYGCKWTVTEVYFYAQVTFQLQCSISIRITAKVSAMWWKERTVRRCAMLARVVTCLGVVLKPLVVLISTVLCLNLSYCSIDNGSELRYGKE